MNSQGPHYETRSGGDGRRTKQSMAELKLRRLTELNVRLREDLDRPRIKVSEASNDTRSTMEQLRDILYWEKGVELAVYGSGPLPPLPLILSVSYEETLLNVRSRMDRYSVQQ
ncbi:hypothetical protein FH972_026153 [Carpinus fangiana]|uniref:Uncharacterized protein n=1 Tax=Carpinus fangiana TaxID=176857 RepID=A0A5N6L3H3_9ROSI|nr:hypothetical protein FH972_026153 [Carpinus fangiana]